MSGHSKWSTIKRKKGAADAKRGQIFSKLSREITIATKLGGGDADLNPRLRLILLKAKGANMPLDNIKRAIEKGEGAGEAGAFVDLQYEVYGPGGVGILVEATTDNRNRTAGEVRFIISKNNGDLGSAGSVTRLFQRKGQIMIPRDAADEDELMELALEAGAEDFLVEEEGYEILTDPAHFDPVLKAIETKEIAFDSAELTHLTIQPAIVTNPKEVAAVLRFVDALEEQDDVNDVFTNMEDQSESEA
ncbi:YebC/PmpR family DNA-binding transcriptional regulator [Verrucomicrobia bacterium]|nr:YebC/PmpR family DNA-binding transcriptional regulator [Verrucomicrobiota bacterium]